MKQPVFLRIYKSGVLVNVKQYSEAQIVIGRNDDIALSLKDQGVSPLHAVIEERDAGYYISDLGSEGGTFRNKQKVFDEALESGDELEVGPFKIEFFIGVPKPAHPPKGVDGERVPATPPPPPQGGKKSEVKAGPPPAEKKAPSTAKPAADGTKGTFAPPSLVNDLNERLKVSKGSIVEVVVAWKERVIGTYHFDEAGEVTVGVGAKDTIQLPLIGLSRPSMTLLKIAQGVRVTVTPEMTGDFYKDGEHSTLSDLRRKNRVVQTGSEFAIDLQMGEMVRLGLYGDVLSIYVRYVPETPKPIVGPLLDLTASESTGVIMSFVITAILALYMLIYAPKALEDETRIEEPIRKATVTFTPPKKVVVQVADEAQESAQKKVVPVKEKVERTTTKQDPGKAAALKPSPKNVKSNIASSAVDQGASIKTGKEGANMQSKNVDVNKVGLLSTFGNKGAQSQLSKAYSGAGELQGMADAATGYAGSTESRAGENLGGRLKNVGAGGKGTATVGISGVGTQGKGTGSFGFGTGGIGKKGRVDLNVGESEAEFSGSIDREAIRRVIRENIKQFQFCYDQALRRNSDAYGKVEVQWNIEERGRATRTVVKSNSIGDREMGECIARVIRGLTFPEPPPDQIAQVTYPFVFTSQ